MVIRSKDNERVKRWRRLLADARTRRGESACVVEGRHLVEEVLAQKVDVVTLLVKESAEGEAPDTGIPRAVLADAVFDSLSELEAPGTVAAEIRLPEAAIDLQKVRSCVALEGVQDPGNVGTIVRTAAAFGVECLLVDAGCADPWSGKALRAGQGGHFRTRVARVADLGASLAGFRGKVIGALAREGRPPAELDLNEPLAWVFGAEGGGLSERVRERCTSFATIPMPGGMESLNVAASAAILLYEGVRRPE